MAENQSVAGSLDRWAAILGGAVAVTGVVVLVGGWAVGIDSAASLAPGAFGMKASTAAAMIACGAALVVAPSPAASSRRRAASRLLSLVPLAIGLGFLSEYVLGWDLRIDEFPFVDQADRDNGIAYPGRPLPTTAANLVLAGTALLLNDLRPWHGWRLAELLALPIALVATASVLAYTYEIPAFYGPAAAAKMAPHTALCFIFFAIGLALARPRGQLVRLASSKDPGDMMARRVLPLAILTPLALGLLELRGINAGLFSTRVGTWWLTATTIGALVLLLWRAAVMLSRADAGRRILETELLRLANTDEMTGLVSRHRFEEELAHLLSRSGRYDEPASLLVFDLDSLKGVNDRMGHAAGDELLKAIAGLMRERLRGSDICGRLGGDEFGILLPQTSEQGASAVAQGVLDDTRRLIVDTEHGVAWTTVSIGVADLNGVDDVKDALALGDRSMYEAKMAGGDRSALASAPARHPAHVA